MRTSPLFMGLLYIIMGILFTYLAIESIVDTIWNFYTILLMIMAAFDFMAAFRLFFQKKRKQ